jgi:hypothetical protein
MSAVPKNTTAFQLFKRSETDVVKARPYAGDHNALIKVCAQNVKSLHKETIMELAKV